MPTRNGADGPSNLKSRLNLIGVWAAAALMAIVTTMPAIAEVTCGRHIWGRRMLSKPINPSPDARKNRRRSRGVAHHNHHPTVPARAFPYPPAAGKTEDQLKVFRKKRQRDALSALPRGPISYPAYPGFAKRL